MRSLVLLGALLATLPGASEAQPRVATLRVHGNTAIPDEEVLRIAGIAEGDSFAPETPSLVEERLRRSGKFDAIDVRVRYRSLSESSDVALVLVVREKPSVPSRLMVGPMFDLTDEYGLTVGGRVALVDLAVEGGRLSFPLSWGGTRRAAVESSFPLKRWGTVQLGVTRWRQEHPHFDVPENRLELGSSLGLRRGLAGVDFRARWSRVELDAPEERFATLGAKLTLDSRRDPTVPGDAFYVGLDWRRLFFLETEVAPTRENVDQRVVDLRGYKRLFGQTLLAVQANSATASGPLPPYEQPFLGGGKTLRGFAPGGFLGDNAALGTVELRVPLTSVRSFARAGVHVFYDIGAVYGNGLSIRKAQFRDAVGAGAFFRVAVVGVRVDWGFALEGGNRFHVASNFKF